MILLHVHIIYSYYYINCLKLLFFLQKREQKNLSWWRKSLMSINIQTLQSVVKYLYMNNFTHAKFQLWKYQNDNLSVLNANHVEPKRFMSSVFKSLPI